MPIAVRTAFSRLCAATAWAPVPAGGAGHPMVMPPTHMPPAHVWPAMHGRLPPPQLAVSVEVLTHEAPQSVWPAGQPVDPSARESIGASAGGAGVSLGGAGESIGGAGESIGGAGESIGGASP